VKILFVTGSFPPMHCGVGDYTARLTAALAQDPEFELSVLTSKIDPAAPLESSIRVFRTMRTWEPVAADEFRRTMREVEPDVVHIQFPTQGYNTADGLVAMIREERRATHVPVVATLHEFIPRGFTKPERAILWIALLANSVVVVRPDFSQNMSWFARTAIGRNKIQFIANASVIPRAALSTQQREQIRHSLGCDSRKLVTFFGFSYPAKGVDLLFEIADPARHHLLLICDLTRGDPYHDKIRALALSERWRGKVTLAGFLGSDEVGRLLAASDAAVFPYRDGGGPWNSSLHAAMTQDTFILTTSAARNGYDAEINTYYSRLSDVSDMRRALLQYAGLRRKRGASECDPWKEIAARHKNLYASLVHGVRRP
jgi:glycosyltransferase involved in cell wall biosynthesis